LAAPSGQCARPRPSPASSSVSSEPPWAVNDDPANRSSHHADSGPCILDAETGSPADRREIRRLAENLGLGFSGFCAQLRGSETFGGLEEEAGLEERIRKTRSALDVAVEMEGPIVTTHVGLIPEDPLDPAYQTLLRSVGAIAKHGEKVGAAFAIETGQETPEALRQFLEDVGSPAVKVNFDPCNLLRYGHEKGVVGGVHTLAPYIVHTHAKDWDPGTRRATCGQGQVPWKAYLAALDEIGYEGVLAIEDETGVEDIDASIAESFAFLKSL